MNTNVIVQLLIFGVEALLTAVLLLGLFRARFRFGLAPFYITIGVFQPIQVLLASSFYVTILPGLAISPGSVVMFTASLFAILLVYIREDAIAARQVIYGIIAANLTMSLLFLIFGAQVGLPSTLNILQLPPELFYQEARVIVAGTAAIFVDVLLIIFAYEALGRLIPKLPFLRIYLTMAIILVIDTLIFATGAFFGQPDYSAIVTAGIVGKTGIAVFYGAALTLYLRFVEPVAQDSSLAGRAFRDIFNTLTYREKYEIERALAEKAVQRSEEKFAIAFRSSPDYIIISSLADGRYIEVNDSFLQATGYGRDEVIGRTALDLNVWANPADRDAFIQLLQTQGVVRNFESTYRQKSGETGVVLLSAEMITFDGEQCLLAISRDITERKEAQMALRRSAERLEVLHEAEQRARRRAEILRDANLALTRSLDLNTLPEILLDYLEQFVPADGYALMLHAGGEDDVLVVATRGNIWTVDSDLPARIQPPPLMQKVLSTQQSVLVADTTTHPEWKQSGQKTKVRNWLGVPLVTLGKLVGLYSFSKLTPNIFTVEHQQIAEALAAPAAAAVENAQLYTASAQQVARLHVLHQIDQHILAAEPPEKTIRLALKHIRELTPCDQTSISLFDWTTKEAETLVADANGASPLRPEGARLSLDAYAEVLAAMRRGQTVAPKGPQDAGARRPHLHVPLIAQKELIGSLNLWASEPGKFSSKHIDIAQEVAAQLAIAIHQDRLRKQIEQNTADLERRVSERTAKLQWQYRRQAALADVELAINQPIELHAVLDRVVRVTAELLPATGAGVVLWDAQSEKFTISASTLTEQASEIANRRIRRSRGATRWIIDHQRPLIVSDVRDDLFEANRDLDKLGLQSYVGLPLLNGAEPLGVLYAYDQQPRTYTQDELDFLTTIANRVAAAIIKVQLYQDMAQRAAELAALYEVSKQITATLDLDKILQAIAENAIRVTGADKSVILLVDTGAQKLLRAVGVGYAPGQLDDHSYEEFQQGISGWVLRERTPTLSTDICIDERNTGLALAVAREGTDKAVAIAPLTVRDEVIGTLTVTNGRHKEPFTPAALNLVTSLAGQAAIAIENARLYEAAQEADRLKSAFLAAMSHELRTPLNSIIGFTGIILQELAGPLNDEQKKQLNMVRGSARHLLALINDVLDISKIEANQLELSLTAFDVRQVIEETINTVAPLAQKKGLALSVRYAPGVGQMVSDRRRVGQILINLVNNAIKYSERGEIKIEAQVIDDQLEVRVIDTGVGIRQEDMDKLFQPFRQVDTGTSRVHEGTGLGLFICRRLVEMLHGEIWAESEWEVGSTFTFTLPLGA